MKDNLKVYFVRILTLVLENLTPCGIDIGGDREKQIQVITSIREGHFLWFLDS